MYTILVINQDDGFQQYMVFNVVTKQEIARYDSYEEAYNDIMGR